MRRIILIAIVAVCVFISGCTDDNVEFPVFRLEEFNSGYVQSNEYRTWLFKTRPFHCSVIEYESGKVSKVIHKNSKRMGIDEYHEVHYKGNIIELIKKVDGAEYAYNPQKVQLTIDEKRRITKRIVNFPLDTTSYYYLENGLLKESISRNGGYSKVTRRFFFDSNRNLVQISGKIDNQSGSGYNIYEYFEQYDSGINAFKDLAIIEGAFIRSLSQNNFNQYRCVVYNNEGILQDSMRLTLIVEYDKNGHPIYGDCSLKDQVVPDFLLD